MELNINILTDNKCKLIIKDLSEYLPESSDTTTKGKFKFSETISIDVLSHNKQQESVNKSILYSAHETNDPIQMPVTFDGWFTITHIVLPSKEWLDNELKKSEASSISLYSLIYVSDGSNIYKYSSEQLQEVEIDELLEVNTVDTTISRVQKEYVSICYLRKCYINLCYQIFNNRGLAPCFEKSNVNSELVYKRDLLWMSLNVIKYLTQFNQLAEAERIIEKITGCNGLCTSYNIQQTHGCGCTQYT